MFDWLRRFWRAISLTEEIESIERSTEAMRGSADRMSARADRMRMSAREAGALADSMEALADQVAASTWTCHVCEERRPNDAISVHSYEITLPVSKIVVGQNIRYCNDRAACIAGAPDVQHVPGERV